MFGGSGAAGGVLIIGTALFSSSMFVQGAKVPFAFLG